MTQYARIIIHTHSLPLGRHYLTYTWDGSPYWPVCIASNENLGNIPWPLELLEYEHLNSDYSIYVRRDVAFGLWARAWVSARVLAQSFKWVYARLVMTAHIWGFAYVPSYEEPSWRHLAWPWKVRIP